MAREAFIEKTFQAKTVKIIEQANQIIREYQAAGYTLTLRQLYYQFVSRDLIQNVQSEYKRLGSIINDARLAGLIDWSSIEDRTRNLQTHSFWSSPEAIIEAAASGYDENLWANQSMKIEVWIEKDALIGVIENVCTRWQIPYFACRGNVSQSEQYTAGKRFKKMMRAGIEPIILHFGDHDPSGLDMTRDNTDRLSMFARAGVTVKRMALNMDQIEEYAPPPNPAKESDSRYDKYVAETGVEDSWELDALDPSVIEQIIEEEVSATIDLAQWEDDKEQVERSREVLTAISARWDEVVEFLGEGE
jgi:hypothetical protein